MIALLYLHYQEDTVLQNNTSWNSVC